MSRASTIVVGLCLASFAAGLAVTATAPDPGTLWMLGPLSSGKLQVVLLAAPFFGVVAIVVASVPRAALQHESAALGLLAVVVCLLAMPVVLVSGFVVALMYDAQPEVRRFDAAGRQYLLTTQAGLASDEVTVAIYRRDGRVYRRTAHHLPWSSDGHVAISRHGGCTLVTYRTTAGDLGGAVVTCRAQPPRRHR